MENYYAEDAPDEEYAERVGALPPPTDVDFAEALKRGVIRVRTPWKNGDWACPLCKYHCYSATIACNDPKNDSENKTSCEGKRVDQQPILGENSKMKNMLLGGEWCCRYPRCLQINFASRLLCYRCGIPRDVMSISIEELKKLIADFHEGVRNGDRVARGRGRGSGRNSASTEAQIFRTEPY